MNQTTGIQSALRAIRFAAGDESWVLGGSAGLLLRGLRLAAPPQDIDLYCDEEDQPVIHGVLGEHATDEPVYSETPIYRSRLSHYRIGDCRVELVGGFEVRALDSRYKVEVKNLLSPYSRIVELNGSLAPDNRVRIAPLAHELVFNALREREDRVLLIAEAMASNREVHFSALDAIAARNELSPLVVSRLKGWLGGIKEGDRNGR